MLVYHGGDYKKGDDIEAPFFVTPNKEGAQWFADENDGTVTQYSADIKNPFIVGSKQDNENLFDLLERNDIDPEELEDLIFDNSPYVCSYILDAAYVTEVRAALQREGYDALYNPSDVLENTNIPAYAVIDPKVLSANASKSAGLLTTSAAELRRQANIQRFGYDPNETPEVDTSYRGSHQPVGPQDENPIRLDDVTKSITGEDAGYPEDFYGSQGMRLYAQPPSFPGDEYGIANQQSYRAIQAVRGNPDAEVTIYRGVPDSDDITAINPGDFVTLSPKYAELHAASGYGPRGEDAGKVISQRVKVRDVYFAGDDVNEFGYFPTDVAANASKPLGILVLEQQARGNKQLGGLLQSQGMDINDLSTADPREIQGLLDIAARRGILDKRSAAGLKRGLLE